MNLKIDLHTHSNYSDGIDSPLEILKAAILMDLDGFAVTDHNTLDGYFEIKNYDCGLMIIPGYEVETDAGHILVLGLEELPLNVENIGYVELIEWIRDRKGVSILAHPAIEWPRYDKWIHSPPDAVEVLNASYPLWFLVDRSKRISDRIQATPVGGSDAHSSTTVGNAYSLINTKNFRLNSVLDSIKKGLTIYRGNLSPISYRAQRVLECLVESFQHHIF